MRTICQAHTRRSFTWGSICKVRHSALHPRQSAFERVYAQMLLGILWRCAAALLAAWSPKVLYCGTTLAVIDFDLLWPGAWPVSALFNAATMRSECSLCTPQRRSIP